METTPDFLQQTDLSQFGLMSEIEKEFSMAQAMTVCHDADRVYGIQLTVKLHRFYYINEEILIKKFGLEDYYAQISELAETAKPRRMTMIGTTASDCEH